MGLPWNESQPAGQILTGTTKLKNFTTGIALTSSVIMISTIGNLKSVIKI